MPLRDGRYGLKYDDNLNVSTERRKSPVSLEKSIHFYVFFVFYTLLNAKTLDDFFPHDTLLKTN